MKRTFPALAAAALGLSLLAACGGDGDADSKAGSGDYCKQIEATKKEIDSLGEGDIASFQSAAESLHKVADAAPSDLKDEWKTMTDAVDKIAKVFDGAGLDDKALEELQSGKLPEGVDMSKLQDIMTTMEDFDTDALEPAVKAIQNHAKDECGVELGD